LKEGKGKGKKEKGKRKKEKGKRKKRGKRRMEVSCQSQVATQSETCAYVGYSDQLLAY
jgi:hypothetical protein